MSSCDIPSTLPTIKTTLDVMRARFTNTFDFDSHFEITRTQFNEGNLDELINLNEQILKRKTYLNMLLQIKSDFDEFKNFVIDSGIFYFDLVNPIVAENYDGYNINLSTQTMTIPYFILFYIKSKNITKIDRNFFVFRGIQSRSLRSETSYSYDPTLIVSGRKRIENNYIPFSTSLDINIALNRLTKDCCLYIINVPGNSDYINLLDTDEREILLAPGRLEIVERFIIEGPNGCKQLFLCNYRSFTLNEAYQYLIDKNINIEEREKLNNYLRLPENLEYESIETTLNDYVQASRKENLREISEQTITLEELREKINNKNKINEVYDIQLLNIYIKKYKQLVPDDVFWIRLLHNIINKYRSNSRIFRIIRDNLEHINKDDPIWTSAGSSSSSNKYLNYTESKYLKYKMKYLNLKQQLSL